MGCKVWMKKGKRNYFSRMLPWKEEKCIYSLTTWFGDLTWLVNHSRNIEQKTCGGSKKIGLQVWALSNQCVTVAFIVFFAWLLSFCSIFARGSRESFVIPVVFWVICKGLRQYYWVLCLLEEQLVSLGYFFLKNLEFFRRLFEFFHILSFFIMTNLEAWKSSNLILKQWQGQHF